MGEYHHLIGVEQMQNAANSMAHAVERFGQHVSQLEWTLNQFCTRFEQAVQKLEEIQQKGEVQG